jgi:hypothetical protein
MTISSWFKSRGVHVSQTTQSLTGGLLTRTTKTPTTPHVKQVRPDGVEKKQHDHVRQKSALKDSEAGHIRYSGANLEEHTVGLLDKQGWADVFRKEKEQLFPGSLPPQRSNLHGQLSWVQLGLPNALFQTPDAKENARVLPGATMTVLLNAASTACKLHGLNAEDAGNAIACLQHIDMLGAIAAPFGAAANLPGATQPPLRSDHQPFTAQDLANAWRIAIELERSGEAGFNLLKHLMHKPAPAVDPNARRPRNAPHPTVGQQRDALLHTYLQAAREKAAEARERVENPHPGLFANGSLMPDPRSLHAHINLKLGSADPVDEPGNPPNDGGVHVPVPPGRVGGRVLNAANNPTLLDKALKAVSNHLCQVENHAANNTTAGKQITFDQHHNDIRAGTDPDKFRRLDKDCNWWAANAVRNGIYSEDSKQYRKLQHRAQKMVTWLHRANNNGAPAVPTKGKRVQRWLNQAFVPWKNKSPFHAYNNIVPDSPHRLASGTDGSGISDGQTIRQDLIWNLEKAIEHYGTPADVGPNGPLRGGRYPAHVVGSEPPEPHPKAGQPFVEDNVADPRVLKQMVRLAILKSQYRFNDTGDGDKIYIPRHNDGDKLVQPRDIERARKKVYAMFEGSAAPNARTTDMIEHFLKSENVQLSPETLIDWASSVGAPPQVHTAMNYEETDLATRNAYVAQAIVNYRAAPVPAPADWSQPDWNAFMDGVNRTLVGQVENFTHAGVDLAALTDTQAAQLFEEVISRQKLGHLIEMKDGSSVGIKTQGISYILSRILSFGVHSVGIDLRYSHGKHADVQFSTGTGGRDLFAGTVVANKGQLGAGYVFGPGHVSKKADGWSVGLSGGVNATPFSGEWAKKVGNLFRFRRVFSGVDSDDVGNGQLGRLMRRLTDPGTDPARDEGGPWINPPGEAIDPATNRPDILKQVLHEFDDVSVGWLKSEDRAFRQNASASGIVGFKAGAWGPALSASLGVEFTQNKTTWREEGGSLNQQRDIKATEARINVSGVLNVVAATIANLNLPADSQLQGLLDPEMWSGAFKAAFQDGMFASADVFRTGTSRRHTWIYHDGAMTYNPGLCSFYQKTHKNAAAYVNSIVRKIDILARDKAKVFERPRFDPAHRPANPAMAGDMETERTRLIKQEQRKLLEDLHAVLTDPEPTEEFREYYEWSPTFLQMINDLESVIKSEKAKPGWERNKAAKARVKDYERQLASLKSLDDETVAQHAEYRFNITDNVEFKQKNKGLNTFALVWHEDLVKVSRIKTYI